MIYKKYLLFADELASENLRLQATDWKTFLNRSGMDIIALNLLTFVERLSKHGQSSASSNEKDVDVSFLLSPSSKPKLVKKVSLFKSSSTPTHKPSADLIGESILDHLMEPIQVSTFFICSFVTSSHMFYSNSPSAHTFSFFLFLLLPSDFYVSRCGRRWLYQSE